METEGLGTQQHTVALQPTSDYEGRHAAKVTFREWWEETLLVAPSWALVSVSVGVVVVASAVFTALAVVFG